MSFGKRDSLKVCTIAATVQGALNGFSAEKNNSGKRNLLYVGGARPMEELNVKGVGGKWFLVC